VVQASTPLPSVYSSPPVIGYFQQWEDYILFVLFVVFTYVQSSAIRDDQLMFTRRLEIFARVMVSGLMLDPDVPLSALFKNPFRQPDAAALSRQHSLTRNPDAFSLTHTFTRLGVGLSRPFTLVRQTSTGPLSAPPRSPSHTRLPNGSLSSTGLLEKGDRAPPAFRHPPVPSLDAGQLKLEHETHAARKAPGGAVELPFKLSVVRGRDVTRRNRPFLRHSWNRLDAVAVAAFWITFTLAMLGVEHGKYHVGIFRGLSVLRSARLLAVTSGTTAIMRSLKTALPLLANVGYFVVFAIGMFSSVIYTCGVLCTRH
jgi:hypothetical protein